MKHKNIFSKDYTENWSRGTFWVDSVMKNGPLAYKIKDSNGEKIIGRFLQIDYKWVIIQNKRVILEIKSKWY